MRALRVLSALFVLVAVAATPPPTQFYGYSGTDSDRERALETQFVDIPTADGALQTVREFAAKVRRGGGPGDYDSALALRDRLRDLGFAVAVEPFTARVDIPKLITLAVFPNGRAEAVASQSRRNDPRGIFSRRPRAARPTPLPAGAPAPTPTPPSVPATYFSLTEPAIASDPDTATLAEPAYFAGSADGDVAAPLVYAGHGGPDDYLALGKHEIAVKGAIIVVRSGREPLGVVVRRAQTYGVAGAIVYDDPADDARGPAYPFGPYRPLTSVRRGALGEGITIPVVPVSAATAQALLATLHGPSAPAPWSGALPVVYPFARGPAYVHLVVQLTRKPAVLYNVSATLVGAHPEQSVIVGARRDAWVYGATDSGGGLATLVEIARGLGFLAKGGFRPERSIVLLALDGEEFGAAGTIAYLRKHGDDVKLGNVAYLDAALPVSGSRFGGAAVAPIAYAIADATKSVDDPDRPGGTVFQRWALRSRTLPAPATALADHPAVLFGSGIPSATTAFTGSFGTAHSGYDTVQYATTYADPTFAYHRAAAQLDGVVVLRLADAPALPYRFAAFVDPLQTAIRGLVVAARTSKVALDRKGIEQSVGRFHAAAYRFDLATARVSPPPAIDRALEAVRILDVALYGSDGYAAARLPDLAHAVAVGDPADVERATARLRATLDHAAELLAP